MYIYIKKKTNQATKQAPNQLIFRGAKLLWASYKTPMVETIFLLLWLYPSTCMF